jgi:hypothetical protein
MNEVATKACKKHKVNPGSARLLNNSFAQTTLLQLLPAKHAKCHAVVVANTALMWDGQQPDVQTVEAALFMRELQVEPLLLEASVLMAAKWLPVYRLCSHLPFRCVGVRFMES